MIQATSFLCKNFTSSNSDYSLFCTQSTFGMSRHDQSFVPPRQDIYHLDVPFNNPQLVESRGINEPQHYLSDSSPWLEASGHINSQYLEGRAFSNENYNLEQLDPALWQYEEDQSFDPHGIASTIHGLQETPIVDLRLSSLPAQASMQRNMMPQQVNDIYPGISPREQAPPKQPFSQMFVVPIMNQTHGQPSPDSNSMFCDFPGIAFRSFLPEGAMTPISPLRNVPSWNQVRKTVHSTSTERPIVMHGPTQPQVYGPFKRKVSGESENGSSQSTPNASSNSRLATPDAI